MSGTIPVTQEEYVSMNIPEKNIRTISIYIVDDEVKGVVPNYNCLNKKRVISYLKKAIKQLQGA